MASSSFRLLVPGAACVLMLMIAVVGPGFPARLSEAQSGSIRNCPAAGKWAISVWDGDEGATADEALDSCGEQAIETAYYLDPESQSWSRWFSGRPDISSLTTLSDLQGIIALGSATAPAQAPVLGSGPHTEAMQDCPPAGKWAISVWSGADGASVDQALATCGADAVSAAYDLDSQTGGWLRWFSGRPDISSLTALDNLQGVIALGSGEPASQTGMIAFVSEDWNVHLVNGDGTGEIALTSDAYHSGDFPAADAVHYSDPAWSWDGRFLAWTRTEMSGAYPDYHEESTLVVYDTIDRTTKTVDVPDRKTSFFTVEWRTGAHSLYLGYSTQEVENTCLTETIKGFRIVELDVQTGTTTLILEFDDGQFPVGIQSAPEPDLLAFYNQFYCEGGGPICILNRNSGDKNCTSQAAGGFSWSPAGERLVFESCNYACDSDSLRFLDAVTLQEDVLLPETQGTMYQTPSWAPQGNAIVYGKWPPDSNEGYAIWATGLDGSTSWKIDDGYVGWQAFSPDATRIVYWKRIDNEHNEVWTASVDGQSKSKVADGDTPVWQPRVLVE